MNFQSLIPYIPFLAVFYAVFALGQTMRQKRQGMIAALLALVSIAAPLTAYFVTSDVSARTSVAQFMAISAAIVFVVSLLTLFLERRNTKRDRNRSYGMFGLALSLLLAMGIFILPIISASTSNTSGVATNTTNAANQSDIVLISAQIPGVSSDQTASATAEATSNVDALPSAPNGQAPNRNFPPPNGHPGSANSAGQRGQAAATETVSSDNAVNSVNVITNTPQSQPSNQTSQTQVTATETVIRPTQIMFPTDTPTISVTATPEGTGTETSTVFSNSAATCTVVVDYNLNLRDLPTIDGSNVYVSIPFGTSVTTDGRTSDGWYRVTYNGQKGWINNEYLTASASCTSLPVVSGS